MVTPAQKRTADSRRARQEKIIHLASSQDRRSQLAGLTARALFQAFEYCYSNNLTDCLADCLDEIRTRAGIPEDWKIGQLQKSIRDGVQESDKLKERITELETIIESQATPAKTTRKATRTARNP
jgi:hypothetical protein